MNSAGKKLLVLAVLASGCGGSSGSSGSLPATSPSTAPSTTTPTQTTTTTTTTTVTPTPLDVDLKTRLANANITAVTPVPPPPPPLVELGRNLFFDKVLSGNRNIACSSCHQPQTATGDGLSLALGQGAVGDGAARHDTASSQIVPRNAPPLFTVGARGDDVMFWDGRVRRDRQTGQLVTPEPAINGPTPSRPDIANALTGPLAAQALFPVASAKEMRGDPGQNELADAPDNLTVWSLLMARLVGTQNGTVGGIDEYRTLFRAAYPQITNLDDLNFGHAASAIAAFEASAFAGFKTPFDRYLGGDLAALSDQQKRGGVFFASGGRCARCHGGPLLSDLRPHALAIPQLGPGENGEPDDRGVALISGNTADNYKFRTPPLRGVGLSGPFMHDGAFTTLDRVLQHYRDPARSLQGYDGRELTPELQATVDTDPTRNQARLAAVDPIVGAGIPMTDAQIQDLVSFLQSLSDPAAQTFAPPASVPSGLPVAD